MQPAWMQQQDGPIYALKGRARARGQETACMQWLRDGDLGEDQLYYLSASPHSHMSSCIDCITEGGMNSLDWQMLYPCPLAPPPPPC